MNPTLFTDLVARLLPLALSVTPQAYSAQDGTTYYYIVLALPGKPLPYHTEASASPLAAYRYARKALTHCLNS